MKNEVILIVVVLVLSYVSGQDTIVYKTAAEKNLLQSHMNLVQTIKMTSFFICIK